MNIGIKIGPHGWKKILFQSQAKYAEIWFRLDWKDKYTSLFKYLNKEVYCFWNSFLGDG